MAMKLVKKSAEYKIYQRGDKRYAVEDGNGKPVNGEAKVNILLAEDLIKVVVVAQPAPEPEVEVAEVVEETAEVVVAEETVEVVVAEETAEVVVAEEAAETVVAEEAAETVVAEEVPQEA